jgi:hypothetical protein
MAVGSDSTTRARNLVFLALVAFAAAVAVLATRDAFARWRPAGMRRASTGHLRITSGHVRNLYPGARRKLVLTVHNTDRRRSVLVARVLVHVTATTRRGCKPSRRNLRIRQYAGPPFGIPPRGTRRVAVTVTMPHGVANACQWTSFRLRYAARVWTGRPRR